MVTLKIATPETKPLKPDSIYAAVGEAGLRQLVAHFYRRIPNDDVIGPMYPPEDLAQAQRRLADFLIYRFGGPQTYLAERGNPKLKMRHMPFTVTPAARDRWVQLMDAALDESGWSADATEVARLFLHQTATFLINRQ